MIVIFVNYSQEYFNNSNKNNNNSNKNGLHLYNSCTKKEFNKVVENIFLSLNLSKYFKEKNEDINKALN